MIILIKNAAKEKNIKVINAVEGAMNAVAELSDWFHAYQWQGRFHELIEKFVTEIG